jgi:hypothetical protein
MVGLDRLMERRRVPMEHGGRREGDPTAADAPEHGDQ